MLDKIARPKEPDVRVMRPARGAGVFALYRCEAFGRARDGIGFAFESGASRDENGTRLLIVGGDKPAGGQCGSVPLITADPSSSIQIRCSARMEPHVSGRYCPMAGTGGAELRLLEGLFLLRISAKP